MINRLVAILALLLPLSATSAAPPRVATVRVSDVLSQLDGSAKANEDYNAKIAAIDKDKRKVEVDTMEADLKLRLGKLRDTSIDEETRKKLLRDFKFKWQEMRSLNEEFQNFSKEKREELNTGMVASIRERLTLIHSTAEKIAKEEGFDIVFDSSGISNTGVPLMLYAKTPNDLTERVLAALAPPPKPPGSTPPTTKPGPATGTAENNKNDKKPKPQR